MASKPVKEAKPETNGDEKPPRARKRFRKLRRWILILAVVFIAFSVVAIEMTSRASFCNNCHIMESYYDSWVADTHSDVQCVECHIPPGAQNFVSAKLNGLGQVVDDWLNRTSTKPSADVSSFACLREGCHLMEELAQPKNEELPFFFNHQKHLGRTYLGVTIQCTTCHSHVKGSKHFEVNTNVCITCHLHTPEDASPRTQLVALAADHPSMTSGGAGASSANLDPAALVAPRNCQACHEPPAEPFEYQGLQVDHSEYVSFGANCESCHRNVTASFQSVSDAQCLQCHIYGMDYAGETDELHRIHTAGSQKVECFNCHGMTAHGPDAATMMLDQFDCQNCHLDQHALQRSAYLTNGHTKPDRPIINPMFMAHVDCNGCHIKPRAVEARPGTTAMVAAAVPEACDKCHRPGLGEMQINLWQKTTREMYDDVMAMLPTEADPWATGRPNAEQAIQQATQLLDQVRLDGSWGVHNPRYTQQLIGEARVLLIEARIDETKEGTP